MFTRFTAPVCINRLQQTDMKIFSPARWKNFLSLAICLFALAARSEAEIPAASFKYFDDKAHAGFSMSVVFFWRFVDLGRWRE